MSRNNKDDITSTYKEMPRNLEAEHDFLGALILDGKLLEKVRESIGAISEYEFYSESNRIIYAEILNRASYTDDFNTTVLCADLEKKGLLEKAGGVSYVAGLTELHGPKIAVVDYGKIIRETSRRRQLIRVSEHIEKLCYSPEGKTVDEVYDEAQGLIYELSEAKNGNVSGPKEMTRVAFDLIQKIKSDIDDHKEMHGVATGFRDLDDLTSGLRGGTLNIIAARPGVGKTSFAMNVVTNIAMNPDEHRPALVFSLEMPANEIAMRMLTSFGRVSSKELLSGKISPDQWRGMIRKVKMLLDTDKDGNEKVKLYIDDTSDIALTPLELRSRARKIAAENGGLSCIMVDYIQLMKSQTRLDNRSQEVGEISRSLKQLSKELNVPILALAQLNREVESRKDHRPMNSDLRESGSLEQDADMIMFIHREDTYKSGNEGDGKAFLIVSKNRNGATADIELQFQGAYTTFYDKANVTATIEDVPVVSSEVYV